MHINITDVSIVSKFQLMSLFDILCVRPLGEEGPHFLRHERVCTTRKRHPRLTHSQQDRNNAILAFLVNIAISASD